MIECHLKPYDSFSWGKDQSLHCKVIMRLEAYQMMRVIFSFKIEMKTVTDATLLCL